ncbi:MAG: YidC/Oxa1 family membrane protein insertase [Acidimicrobiia bacterium]|nr:YidC/Oxa1 family membrane protein insertase [Acidimicrobiia bacterium]
MAWFDAIKNVLGWFLGIFYDIVPNYGIAIVMLTILINLVLFPLTLKQTRSTRAFQTIQPEIKRLQAKHKEDPQMLQSEMMRIQKEAGATPGGCLIPLLVQMPIWFALFRVLRGAASAEEIVDSGIPVSSSLYQHLVDGGGRFLGMDLGLHPADVYSSDGLVSTIPYLVLIALMVAVQFIQQWHAQPRDGRPQDKQAQQMQTITKFMPLFIGFISWSFPAGLTLYWATSNTFRLGQQAMIFRMDGRPPPPQKAEAKDAEADSPEQQAPKPQGASKKKQRRRRS